MCRSGSELCASAWLWELSTTTVRSPIQGSPTAQILTPPVISVADNARKAVEDRRNLKRAVNDRTVQSGSQEIVLNTCALARKSKIFKGQELVSVDEVVGRDAENQEEEDITHINRMLGLDGSDEASDYYLGRAHRRMQYVTMLTILQTLLRSLP